MKKLLGLLLLSLFFIPFTQAQDSVDDYFEAYVTPDYAIANQSGTWTVVIKAKKEIKANARFKIRWIKGFKDLQQLLAGQPGYVTGTSSAEGGRVLINTIRSSYDENMPFWDMNVQDKIITFTSRLANLQPGDSLSIIIGQGSKKSLAHSTACKENIEIAVALDGSSNFQLTSHRPEFEIRPTDAVRVHLFANSVFAPSEEGKLLITTSDEFFNIAEGFTGTIQLSGPGSDQAVYPASVTLTPADQGKKEIPIYFLKEGTYVIKGSVAGNPDLPVVQSNPIRVSSTLPKIYWGDLHSHGAPSRDGIGRGRYYYARYARALDFFCATDHADHGKTIFGITEREWVRQKQEVLDSHEPGKFVPFIGYENSFLYPIGHYNIIFNVKDEDIERVPIWPMRQVNNIQKIWENADNLGFDILTIPHHCGKVFNINSEVNECKNCNTFGGIQQNPKYKRLVEIFSFHGQSESYNPNHNLDYRNRSNIARSYNGPNYAQDAWAIGEMLGVIASSDDHIGHPGTQVNGVAAVFASELERDTIFTALKNRTSYGTTGEKMWVDFKVSNARMGAVIQIPPSSKPRIQFDVIGTDSIAFVEVLKWDFKRGVYEGGHPKFEIIGRYTTDPAHPTMLQGEFTDNGMSDSCMYYLRAKQTNLIKELIEYKEVWAWTSPVWVSHLPEDPQEQQDSLINYTPKTEGKQIKHFWTVYNPVNVKDYLVERRNNDGSWSLIGKITPSNPSQTDFELPENLPQDGTSTYRLVMELNNGSSKVSETKTLTLALDVLQNTSYELDGTALTLKWDISKELHSDRYEIEWKDATGNFTLLDVVVADIRPTELLTSRSFQYVLPGYGTYTFRIKQIIDEKNYRYSEEIVVTVVPTKIDEQSLIAGNISLKTNLLSNGQPLEIMATEVLKKGRLYVIDLSGRLVKDLGVIRSFGNWKSYALPNLPAGTYRVVAEVAQERITLPFVVAQ